MLISAVTMLTALPPGFRSTLRIIGKIVRIFVFTASDLLPAYALMTFSSTAACVLGGVLAVS